ncbi:MAG: NAD(P)-dependent oxidoreductase [Rhodospirillaceae bacterium]|nr:NAD(P)-dependent oxidoreductase [Rhodospirillaceae bacterium]
MSNDQKHLFCFGLGYSAERLARDLIDSDNGWTVAGTSRSEEKTECLNKIGVKTLFFNGEQPISRVEKWLESATHLVISAPPGPQGDPVLRYHKDDIAQLSNLEWVGYLSTTGVYGDRKGEWVDETAELTPTSPRGVRRVAAECAWMDLWCAHQVPVHLFRLAGIYGPGRNALETVRSGRARRIDKPGQVFSRIHVDDIAQILKASIENPNPGASYNVCDDEAAAPRTVIEYACRLLRVEPPPLLSFDEADLSEMARSFYADNKRVSNERIKKDLMVELKWPTYREGLQGLL